MKNEKLYELLVSKMHEVSMLPPQTVGPLTPLYKRIVPYFKVSPWKSIALVSLFATTLVYFLFGMSLLIKLASLLQFGF